MAKLGKTNAGKVTEESVPCLKSRGLKNPMPQAYELKDGQPNMAADNDKPGASKGGKAPESHKKAPGEM